MKKILIYTLSGLIAIIGLLLIIGAMQPTQWQIERSILINAPQEKVWTMVSNLHRYSEWNPYARLEPTAQITVEGEPATVGSSYSWDGKQSGKGRMTTIALQAGERVDFRLDFTSPMEVTNSASFVIKPEGEQTSMTWIMLGEHKGLSGLIGRTIHLFVSMEDMLGSTFESGLATLKEILEKPQAPQP